MGQKITKSINADNAIDLLLKDKKLDGNWVSDRSELELYHQFNEICNDPSILHDIEDLTTDEFYEKYTNVWYMPDKYKDIDVEEFVLKKCKTDTEVQRVNLELQLFKEKDLFCLLQFLIFLVDYFRENNFVWGVGRGSSVSSYVLYLIGVHKIDSIKYKLDIKEFLK